MCVAMAAAAMRIKCKLVFVAVQSEGGLGME